MSGWRILPRQGSVANATENTIGGEIFWDPTNRCIWFGKGDSTGGTLASGSYYPRIDTSNNLLMQSGTYLSHVDNTGMNLFFDSGNFQVRAATTNLVSVSSGGLVGIGAAPSTFNTLPALL